MGKTIFAIIFTIISVLGSMPQKTDADIILPIWGKMLYDKCILDINVSDSLVIINERSEMLLVKLVADDYLFTFMSAMEFGCIDTTSLDIFYPQLGAKQVISNNTLELEYLSLIALEETLEVEFEYSYSYDLTDPSCNVSEIIVWRWATTKGRVEGDIESGNKSIEIRCNQEVVAKKWWIYGDTATIGDGTHITYHYPIFPRHLRDSPVKIILPGSGNCDTITQEVTFELVQEHREYISNLIKDEFIQISVDDRIDGFYNYRLTGTIQLDVDVAELYAPFWAWFPNEHTNAIVKLKGFYDYWHYGYEAQTVFRVVILEVEPSNIAGQDGFYISIPLLSDTSTWWYETWTCRQAELEIEIDTIHSQDRNEFILVTAPQESSEVSFTIPEQYFYSASYSPFEKEAELIYDGRRIKKFSGRCESSGIAFVEWKSTDVKEEENKTMPQDFVLSQNYPNPFNLSTEIRFTLPDASKIFLNIYNVLGQKVATLVDEEKPAGTHTVFWHGKDKRGDGVASGIYLYEIKAGEYRELKKMLLIK